MNLAVAVGTGAIKGKSGQGIMRPGRMAGLHMASLTEPGFGHNEQLLMIGAMGFMAVGAVFHHRGMLPQERTPFLGMAGITQIVDGVGFQEFIADRAMGVVAIGAGHFPFP